MSKFISLRLFAIAILSTIPQGGGFANASHFNLGFPVSAPARHQAALHRSATNEMNHTSQQQKLFCENIPKQGCASLRRPVLSL